MPGPEPVPVHGDDTLPSRVDVVVIGGGIIGCSTALELCEAGKSVAICEKGGIGHEQSTRNWGWVRLSRRDPREVPLMVDALRQWDGLAARVGTDLGYRRTGISFVCRTDEDVENHRRWQRHLEPFQIPSRILSRSELEEMAPGGEIDGKGALYTPQDGRAEPQKAAPAIAEAARAKGAAILTNCAVRGVETKGGAVSGVITERGSIACDAVVVAGGAWSNLFCGNIDIDLPQLGVVSHVLRTDPVNGGPEGAMWTNRFAIRKRQDGGYTLSRGSGNTVDIVPNSFRYARKFFSALRMQHRDLHLRFGRRFFHEARRKRRWRMDETSPFEQERVLDPTPSPRMLNDLMGEASKVFPALKGARVAQSWAGCIDVTPDAVPVISAVDGRPGLHIATGFSGHGFGIGPGAGGLMADLVLGRTPRVDPHAFRFSRFTDGSRVAPDEGF
ncbi:glycine/D-amino acid oxidase-like deaminating enzyme [Palleronia aestuarii]|uniref:Glycine/D-amino acid oxidase-like deaminating enzyme n=1 Tax=Palleronia aestuarii TaxID=568105 RepID=A0A2W7P5S2_9RHOB|nr:FAD-binding oxidoreductase [Palleronia aestuarii]PZX18762.1 glycine/D-amino acid oxidase-like deaminating enzyme [Palleronia aestuarii]